MKRIIYLAGCLLLTGALCWSCSDDDGDDNGNGSGNGGAVLDKGTQTEQVVYANDKGIKDEGIKFTAQGPWKAEVEEVTTRSEAAVTKTVDWLALSQYSGDKAGDYTITLTLKQNFTGKSRKAEIRIICGKTVITITVEQKAEKEDGVKLKRVKSVNFIENYGSGYAEHEGNNGDKATYTYSYDEQGRVAKVVEKWDVSDTEGETDTYMFDYHIVGEITVNHHSEDFYTDSNGQQHKSESDEKYLLTLNNQGNVVNINESDDYDETDTKAGYTEDGRLGKLWEDTDKNGYEWYEKFFYTDGLLTKAEIYESDYDTEVQEFKVDELYPNRYPAAGTNIDFNAFLFEVGMDDIEPILYQIGLLGKGSDCLMEIGGYSENDESASPVPWYTEPGKVYKKTEKRIKYPEGEIALPVKYEFDGDKYVTKFSYEDPYELYEYYYEIHVGYELVKPNNPDMGYQYEVKNEKWTKLRDEKNTYTYTVTYE